MFTGEDEKVVNETEQKSKVKIAELDIELDEDILQDEDSTPETEAPPEEQSDTPKGGQPSQEPGQLPSEFEERIKDKSADELKKMLYESQRQIGKLGKEIGDTKKGKNELAELKEQRSDVESSLRKLKRKMEDNYDEDLDKDDDEYIKLQREVKKKESRLKELEAEERDASVRDAVQKQMDSQHNIAFLKEQRSVLAEGFGLPEIEDEIWDNISEAAQDIAGKGEKITEEDVQAATIKTIGYKNYAKFMTAVAKQNVRESIATAQQKTTHNLKGGSPGVVKLTDMSPGQIEKMLDHLYKTDYNKFQEVAEKIRDM